MGGELEVSVLIQCVVCWGESLTVITAIVHSDSRVAVKPSVTLLTGSDMSVINSGPEKGLF